MKRKKTIIFAVALGVTIALSSLLTSMVHALDEPTCVIEIGSQGIACYELSSAKCYSYQEGNVYLVCYGDKYQFYQVDQP